MVALILWVLLLLAFLFLSMELHSFLIPLLAVDLGQVSLGLMAFPSTFIFMMVAELFDHRVS